MDQNVFHPHCASCCAAGLCHFCLRIGEPAARIESGHVLRLCRKHLEWCREDARAPVVGRTSVPGMPAAMLQEALRHTFQIVELAERAPGELAPRLLEMRPGVLQIQGSPACLMGTR